MTKLIDVHTLLNPRADRALFAATDADYVTQADISVAQLKELMLAINVLSDRQQELVKEVGELQDRLQTIGDVVNRHDDGLTGEK